jgi:hypothetical protein
VEVVVTFLVDPSLKAAVAAYEEVAPEFMAPAPVTARLLKLVLLLLLLGDEEQAERKPIAKMHNTYFAIMRFFVFIGQSFQLVIKSF